MKSRRVVLIALAVSFMVIMTDCSDKGVGPEEEVPEEEVLQDLLVTMADKKGIDNELVPCFWRILAIRVPHSCD